jgi:hypothetical protein
MTDIFQFVLGMHALFLFALGLRGILTKKPFLTSSRWYFSVCLVSWAIMLLRPQSPFFIGTLIVFIGILIVMWLDLPCYIAYGITDSLFRQGLISTLENLEIPFEENLSGLYLSSIDASLLVPKPSWFGVVPIRVRPRKFKGVLRKIAGGMSSYYQTNNGSINLTTSYVYLIVSAFMMLLSVVLFMMGSPNQLR